MGELLIGLLLGPSLIDLFNRPYFHDAEAHKTVRELGEVGVIFLMFAAGLEIQLADFLKLGRAAVLTGVSGVIVPVVLGAAATLPFGYDLTHSVFIGVVLSATSVSILAQTLMELGKLRTREGLTLLGAAVVDDVLGIVALSAFIVFATSTGSSLDLVWAILRMAIFLVAAFFIGRWLLPRLAAWADRLPVSEGVVAAVIVMVLIFAWASEVMGGWRPSPALSSPGYCSARAICASKSPTVSTPLPILFCTDLSGQYRTGRQLPRTFN